MSILFTIIIGGIAGWIATLITRDDAEFGIIGNIIIGVLGSILGMWIFTSINGVSNVGGFGRFLVAIAGSVLLLVILNAIMGRKTLR